MNRKILVCAMAVSLLFVFVVVAEVAPTFRDVGFIWYGKYMNANGSQLTNLSNLSFENVTNTSAKARVTILFNQSAGSYIDYNHTLNLTYEFYTFRQGYDGTDWYRIVNVSPAVNMATTCSRFATELNTNSTNYSASTCSGNQTIISLKWYGTGRNSVDWGQKNASNITISNLTNSTVLNTLLYFDGGANFTTRYFDFRADESIDSNNASQENTVIRSRNANGVLTERLRIEPNKANGAIVFSDILLPYRSTPIEANGAIWVNSSDGYLYYYATAIKYANGTVR